MENNFKNKSMIAAGAASLAIAAFAFGQAGAPAPAAAGAAPPAFLGGGRGGGAGWNTQRADAQRTAWVRSDGFISVENLQKPGYFGLDRKSVV